MAIKWINKNLKKQSPITRDVYLRLYKINGRTVGVIRFRNGCASRYTTVELGIDGNRLYMRFGEIGELASKNSYSLYATSTYCKTVNTCNAELMEWMRTYGGEYPLQKDAENQCHYIEGVK